MPPDVPDFTPSNYRILVVDDDNGILDIMHRILAREGYQCEISRGGYAGLEILERQSFDLAIVDIYMPDMDGFEVLQRIRADPRSGAP